MAGNKSLKAAVRAKEDEFYTQLTDVLRRYIHERYGVNSLEMTSGEILNIIRTKAEEDSVYENLKQVLTVADLVKFAKFTPEAEQNESDYTKVYYFVEETKPVEVNPEAEENE